MVRKTKTTQKLAEFIVNTGYRDISKPRNKLAKELILRCIGGQLGGTQEPSSAALIKFIKESGGTKEAAVVGCGFKSSAVNAAFLGGLVPHAIEIEDTFWPGASSPISVIPVALALAEKMGLSGKDIIEGFVIGFEVQAALANSIAVAGTARGVSPLTSMGAIGAAATAAKMMKFNVDVTRNALGVAASQAVGYSDASVGNMTHYLQSGASCRNGLTAALLARDGFTAHPECLEITHGVLDVLAGEGAWYPGIITDELGKSWRLDKVNMKKYPVCTLNHRIIDGVLSLVKEHNILPEQVEIIEVEGSEALPRILHYFDPQTAEEAQFSLQHNVATALMERKLDADEFTNEKMFNPKRRAMMKKVKINVHHDWSSAGLVAGTNPIAIKLKDGRTFECDCVYARGGAEERLSSEEVSELFRPLARKVLSEKKTKRLEELVLKLEDVADMSELSSLLIG